MLSWARRWKVRKAVYLPLCSHSSFCQEILHAPTPRSGFSRGHRLLTQMPSVDLSAKTTWPQVALSQKAHFAIRICWAWVESKSTDASPHYCWRKSEATAISLHNPSYYTVIIARTKKSKYMAWSIYFPLFNQWETCGEGEEVVPSSRA